MKRIHLLIFSGLFFLCACTIFDARQSSPDPVVLSPKPLVLPIGKKWQVLEEAPKLTDERGHLPFQNEQSVQPEGAKPISPAENCKIETQK